jgi:heptosyltransferase-2
MRKIGILQTAFLGDTVLVAEMIGKIKELYGDEAQVYLIAKKNIEPIFDHDPRLTGLITYDKNDTQSGMMGLLEIIFAVRKLKLDTLLCVQRFFRSSVIARLSGAKQVIGFKDAALSSLFSKRVERIGEHEVFKNHLLLEAMDENFKKIRPDIKHPYILFPPATSERKDLTAIEKGSCIAIAPGSKWHTKRWTSTGYAETISKLLKMTEYKIIITGDKADIKFSDAIVSMLHPSRRIVDMTGKLSIPELFYLLSKARLLITNDSAPQHIAVGLGVPVIAIFGPTTKSLGFYPFSEKAAVMEAELDCRPCGPHGHMECPKKTHACMLDVKPDAVFEIAIRLI